MQLPRLYPILDQASFADESSLFAAAEQLLDAGVTLLQYRNKSGNAREMLGQARALKRLVASRVQLIMNDRADLCVAAAFDGVHVGQDDLSPDGARFVIGASLLLGVSTHNPEQLAEADLTSADYLAIGPVFATASKHNLDPVIAVVSSLLTGAVLGFGAVGTYAFGGINGLLAPGSRDDVRVFINNVLLFAGISLEVVKL